MDEARKTGKPNMNRRTFLKTMGATAAAVGLSTQPKRSRAAATRGTTLRALVYPWPPTVAFRDALPEYETLALERQDGVAQRGLTRGAEAIEVAESGFPIGDSLARAIREALEESEKNLLASVVFADEVGEESYSAEQVSACLKRLEGEGRELHKTELRTRVRDAERAGDLEEAMRLTEELNRLAKA